MMTNYTLVSGYTTRCVHNPEPTPAAIQRAVALTGTKVRVFVLGANFQRHRFDGASTTVQGVAYFDGHWRLLTTLVRRNGDAWSPPLSMIDRVEVVTTSPTVRFV